MNLQKVARYHRNDWHHITEISKTDLEGAVRSYELIEKSDKDWYGYKIEDNVFHAAGDPEKLAVLLETFKEIAEG